MERTERSTRVEQPVWITAGSVMLEGLLGIPAEAHGVVLFAHASGNCRFNPHHRTVARMLRTERLATLLIDLLTAEEAASELRTQHLSQDIGLLALRLIAITDWLTGCPETHHLRIGYFGDSMGVGAAIVAAAERVDRVGAIVSQVGRPDLADLALHRVHAPLLLLVGGEDFAMIALSRAAMDHVHGEKQLVIIPGVTDLATEPGILAHVAHEAGAWFNQHLLVAHTPAPLELLVGV